MREGTRPWSCGAAVNAAMAESKRLPFVYISGEEVRELVKMPELIEEMSRGLQWVSAGPQGGVVQPVRSVVQVDKYAGYVRAVSSHTAFRSSLFPTETWD